MQFFKVLGEGQEIFFSEKEYSDGHLLCNLYGHSIGFESHSKLIGIKSEYAHDQIKEKIKHYKNKLRDLEKVYYEIIRL